MIPSSLVLTLLSSLSLFSFVRGATKLNASALVGRYDPCYPVSARANLGSTLVVGIVYWPGAFLSDWYTDPANTSSLINPCNYGVQQMLADRGGYVAVYRVRTSRLSVLRSTLYEELNIWDQQGLKNTSLAGVMSIMAFSQGKMSPPRYIRVDSNPTFQAKFGFTYSGVVSSLALIAYFDQGLLRYLYWHDLGCLSCGGKKNKYCISGISCAADIDGCYQVLAQELAGPVAPPPPFPPPPPPPPSPPSPPGTISTILDSNNSAAAAANATLNAIRDATNSARTYFGSYQLNLTGSGSTIGEATTTTCGCAINMAFSGTDAKGRIYTTSNQILKLTQYSVAALYTNVVLAVKARFNSTTTNTYSGYD